MSIINEIRMISGPLIEEAKALSLRTFHQQIDWQDRQIGIMGPKGVGKTTLLMQRMAQNENSGLYLSLDHPLVSTTSTLSIAKQFYIEGGRNLFLDEVHKYAHWSEELKNIYDTLPALKVVFSGSSTVRLSAQGGDLSRRASLYSMPVLSLREFIELESGHVFKPVKLGELISRHEEIAREITAQLQPIPVFRRYLDHGAYPFYREGLARYPDKLRATVLYTIESDLVQVHQLEPRYIPKLKKLVQLLASEVPFTLNISALAQSLDISRATTLRYLELLELGGILALLQRSGRGYQKISKPEKVYLDNTNLLHAFAAGKEEVGTVRETFALSQLRASGQNAEAPARGDFLVNEKYTFEVGGRKKSKAQLTGADTGYVFRDDIEVGSGSIIPLWLLGLLY